jgi:hypothetical protein
VSHIITFLINIDLTIENLLESMKKLYTIVVLFVSTLLLVSFSANPPDGMTGAPGDSLCVECHVQANPPINGQISVEGFPSSITPGESYQLTVVNRNTVGDAVKGGFQMTILGPFNTRAGTMADPSTNSTITNVISGRQYFEHNPAVVYPDSNVVKWTVEWTAPELTAGSEITWYAAGNIANGNFQNTGDRIVSALGKGTIVISANEEIVSQKPSVYPNPGIDQINIVLADGSRPDGKGVFYSLTGSKVAEAGISMGVMNSPELPTGVYLIEIRQGEKTHVVRWSKI